MARTKKAPAVPTPDMSAVNGILAKARALATSATKHKDGGELESPTPATKAKANTSVKQDETPVVAAVPSPSKAPSPVMPPPAGPPLRLRSKTPESIAVPVQPKAAAPAQMLKASGSPPAKHAAPAEPEAPKANAPTPSLLTGSAFERTQEILAKAKALRVATEKAAPAEHTPAENTNVTATPTVDGKVTDVIVTPPPKASFKSPAPETPVSKMTKLDSFDSQDSRWDYPHSQKEWYGSQGKSWWNDDAYGWSWGQNTFYDGNKNRWVGCWGSNAWTWDSTWEQPDQHSPDQSSPVPSPTTSPSDQGTAPAAHSRLAARQPTFEEPGNGVVATVPPHEVVPETPVVPGTPATVAASENEHTDETVEGVPDAESSDEWRRDKSGVLLNPQALYMRFYRKIRSILTRLIGS